LREAAIDRVLWNVRTNRAGLFIPVHHGPRKRTTVEVKPIRVFV